MGEFENFCIQSGTLENYSEKSVHGGFETLGLLISIYLLSWEIIRIHKQTMISGLAMKFGLDNKVGAKVNDGQIISALTKSSSLCCIN